MTNAPLHPLDYADVRIVSPSKVLVAVAMICGIAPLAVGVMTLLLFVATRSMAFAAVGLFTLLAGCVCFVVGILCLVIFRYQASRAAPEDALPARRTSRIALTILLLNLPVAAACTWAGNRLIDDDHRVIAVISNEGTTRVERIELDTSDSVSLIVGPLEAGVTTSVPLSRKQLRSIRYRIMSNGVERVGRILDPPFSPDQLSITIRDDSIQIVPVSW